MKVVQKIVLTVVSLLALSVLAPVAMPHAFAQTAADEVCNGIATASGTGCNGSNTSLDHVVANAINILSIVIGLVAVIMIMVAGFKYISAGGDSNSVSSAKTTLIYAIIGLVIVSLAQAIVHFVLHAVNTAPGTP